MPAGQTTPKMRPRRRGNTGVLGVPVRVGELLKVAESADVIIFAADPVRRGFHRVFRHWIFSFGALQEAPLGFAEKSLGMFVEAL